jgi:NADPH:quinone reductase-like Zn-dependent oxidoreductase
MERMMKAIQFSRFGGPEVLELVDLPEPHAGPGQIRIAVRAVGISATDGRLRSGEINFGEGLPQRTGHDVAGIVDEVGAGVSDVRVGDCVFGIAEGAAAEFAIPVLHAPIPPHLGFVDAAALPVAIETATRSLDELGVGAGKTLLISGAAGGIGTAAVQLAVARGARVIGTASPGNHGYLRLLGAEPVAYGEGLADRVHALSADGVDLALSVVGGDVVPVLIELAGSAQNVIELADMDRAKQHGVRFSDGAGGNAFHALTAIGPLIEAGKFWLPVERTFPLERIGDAHRVSDAGHVRGRLVVVVG